MPPFKDILYVFKVPKGQTFTQISIILSLFSDIYGFYVTDIRS